MALFTRNKKKTGAPNEIYVDDEIVGTLDELVAQRIPLTITVKKFEKDVSVYFVDDKKELIRIQNDPFFDEFAGKTVNCGFLLDKYWHSFESKILIDKADLHLTLPEVIVMTQRRKNPRASLTAREKVKVTALEGLGSGIGVTGYCVDISVGGACMAIERAMILQQEREVQPHPDLLAKDTKLMIVKVNKIPGVPPFDAQGKVNRIFRDGMTWKMGIEFTRLAPNIESLVSRFVDERAPRIRPMRRSRKRRLEMEDARKKELSERNEAATESRNDNRPDLNFTEKKVSFFKETESASTEKNLPPQANQSAELKTCVFNEEYDFLNEPEPAVAEPAAPSMAAKTPEPQAWNRLLSMGDELKENLDFLNNISHLEWNHVDNPLKVVKTLNERKPGFLLLPWSFKNQNMLEYVQRINTAVAGVEIIIFYRHDIAPREIIIGRMAGVRNFIKLPLESTAPFLKIIDDKISAMENKGENT